MDQWPNRTQYDLHPALAVTAERFKALMGFSIYIVRAEQNPARQPVHFPHLRSFPAHPIAIAATLNSAADAHQDRSVPRYLREHTPQRTLYRFLPRDGESCH